ncbi:MAG: cytochrome c-type biogenesis protein CcmH, partial [Betaproteobacteria bacterium]|nr:cytochrome c-type biogenesis protein CcmH [Betaproteobacteria bacterium]
QEILDFMVARYGDFVLYKPPFKATTALLWVGPFVLLALALVTLAAMARRRRNATAEPDLGAEERRLVAQALGTQEDRK